MDEATIWTERVTIGEDPATIEVTAEVRNGTVKPAMVLWIPLNSQTSLWAPIIGVTDLGEGRVSLVVDCEEEDGAEIFKANNFEEELLTVTRRDPGLV